MENQEKKEAVKGRYHPNVYLSLIVGLISLLLIINIIDLYTRPKITLGCIDSDNGKDAYSIGILTGDDGSIVTDYCSGGVLNEYYCDEYNNSQTLGIRCAFECRDGVCIRQEINITQISDELIREVSDLSECVKEICGDNKDNDCDALIDEGCKESAVCGDGLCTQDENPTKCSEDCSCEGPSICFNYERKCVGNGFSVCANHDKDTCNEWGPVSDCGPGYTCENGHCLGKTICEVQCDYGEKKCVEGGFVVCDQATAGCHQYSPVYSCGDGFVCESGDCVKLCTNDMFCQSQYSTGCIDSNTRYYCEEAEGQCFAKKTANCAENSYCDKGVCVELPLCEDDIDCLRPRNFGCIDNSTWYSCQQNQYGCWEKKLNSCPQGSYCDSKFVECKQIYP